MSSLRCECPGARQLQVNLVVLACLSKAVNVTGSWVLLEADLHAEGMAELLCTAAALLTQEALLWEVLTQGCIVAVVVLGPSESQK